MSTFIPLSGETASVAFAPSMALIRHAGGAGTAALAALAVGAVAGFSAVSDCVLEGPEELHPVRPRIMRPGITTTMIATADTDTLPLICKRIGYSIKWERRQHLTECLGCRRAAVNTLGPAERITRNSHRGDD